jgi:hypothetical protein
MAKPMLVTLPFVLLLLDFWPLQRLESPKSAHENRTEVKNAVSANKRTRKPRGKNTPGSSPERAQRRVEPGVKPAEDRHRWVLIRPLLLEKIPFFALAALSSIITFIAQREGGAVKSVEAYPLGVRIANAFVSYIMYIQKTVWPTVVHISPVSGCSSWPQGVSRNF